MTEREKQILGGSAVVFVLLAFLPMTQSSYLVSMGVSLAMYTVLATSWAMFSGPTNYISLAPAAFFGIGMYIVAIGNEVFPYPVLLLLAALAGAILAAVIGLATIRISGVYFVIFTLGLAELVRQITVWGQSTMGTHAGILVLTDINETEIYWQLLGMAAFVFLIGWWIGRSRLGFALRVIGNDEVVAVHSGINTAQAKIILFIVSSVLITVTGAIVAPQWGYIEPGIAFSPFISFQIVIMALLGGVHRLWGPMVGAIPFNLLWELINAHMPSQTTLLLGVAFLLIVYFIPRGIVGVLEKYSRGWRVRHE